MISSERSAWAKKRSLQIQQRRFRVCLGRGTVVVSKLLVVAAGIEVFGQVHRGPRLYPGRLR